MRKVKVLNIIADLSVAGAQTVVMNLAKKFINHPEVDYEILAVTRSNDQKYEKEAERLGIKVIYSEFTPSKSKVVIVRALSNWLRYQIAIFKCIKKNKPDVIHTHVTPILKYSIIPVFLCKIKKKFHTLHSDPYALSFACKMLITIAVKWLDYYPICVTEEQAEKAEKRYGIGKCSVIHNGVEISDYTNNNYDRLEIRKELGIEESCRLIGYVGRLNAIKNLDFLINIFEKYSKANNNSKLMIIGDGPEREHLCNLVKDYGIEDKVLFLGVRDDVIRLFKAMDVFMIVSHHESSSIVTVEAQLSNVYCVIADSIPSNVIISDDVCVLRLDDPIDVWVAALVNHKKNVSVVNSYKEFDINNATEKLRKFYMNCVGE